MINQKLLEFILQNKLEFEGCRVTSEGGVFIHGSEYNLNKLVELVTLEYVKICGEKATRTRDQMSKTKDQELRAELLSANIMARVLCNEIKDRFFG